MSIKIYSQMILSSKQLDSRIDEKALPHECNLAELRKLPYPYKRYFTITSDCDRFQLIPLIKVANIFRNEFALPISDSFFVKWLYTSCQVAPEDYSDPCRYQKDNFLVEFMPWLRAFHEGAFDTIHGWTRRLIIKIAEDFVIENKKEKFRKYIKYFFSKKNVSSSKKLYFKVPEGWHSKEEPRYFIFKARMPIRGSHFIIKIYSEAKSGILSEISSDSLSLVPKMESSWFVIDLWPILGVNRDVLDKIWVEFSMNDSPGILEIQNPILTSTLRHEFILHLQMLKYFNIGAKVFTSHGGGNYYGLRHVESIEGDDWRTIPERNDSPFYALDIMKETGIRFINTANNISSSKTYPIEQLAFINQLNNGESVWDFHKYCSEKVTADYGGNITYSEYIGRHIADFINNCNDWEGAMLYTHDIVTVKDETAGELNEETKKYLKYISCSFYGINSPRIWVAPTSILLRYSQVIQEIINRAWYDNKKNSIYIIPWTDVVSSERIPFSKDIRELRHITFYVQNSSTARLFVDDVEYKCITRNSPDETGRESITIVDTHLPRKIIGKVPVYSNFKNRILKTGLEINEENVFTLFENKGVFKFNISHINLFGDTVFGWKVSRSHPDLKLSISIIFKNGLILKISEHGINKNSNFMVLPYCYDEYYISLAELRLANHVEDDKLLPSGELDYFELEIFGEKSFSLKIEEIAFYRDDESAMICGGVMLGGRVDIPISIERIIVSYQGRNYETAVMSNGYYLFRKKFPLDSVVSVRGVDKNGQSHFSIWGEKVELYSNRLDIDFRNE